jgi:hypothetical protein
VRQALSVWMLFPTQIETDLKAHYPGCSIGQWHRGEMSSRELLVLLNGLPDRSRFKGALRGRPFDVDYDWAPEEYRAAAVARQQAPLNKEGDLTLTRKVYESYFSPVERKLLEDKQRAESDLMAKARNHIRAGAYAHMKGNGK